MTPLSGAGAQEIDVHRQDAVALAGKVFNHLNQRDCQQAAQYFTYEVTLTGAEPAALAGRNAVIGHFRQSPTGHECAAMP